MKVEMLRDGKWALGGVNIVEMEKGHVQDFGAKDNEDLVTAGWAKYHTGQIEETASKQEDIDWLEVFAQLEKDDFTTTGKPRVKAVEGIVGHDLTSEEVKAAWDENNS